MKLTPEVLLSSPSYLNPLGDREISLRGLKIPVLENLGITRDQLDTLDLTDNEITTLPAATIPKLDRLKTLYLGGNSIGRIESRVAFRLPRLTCLVLNNNQLKKLGDLDPLGRFPLLEYLSLVGNPVAREKYYREYVVWRCKSVRVLDFRRVGEKERQVAKSLFETSDGRPTSLALSLSSSTSSSSSSSSSDARQLYSNHSDPSTARRVMMSKKERMALEKAIEAADTLEEVRRLEEKLRLGYEIGEEEEEEEGTRAKRRKKGKKDQNEDGEE